MSTPPSAPAPGGSPTAAPPGVSLDPVASAAGKAKPANKPEALPTKYPTKFENISHAEQLLAPVLAAAGVFVVPESFIGKKALTFLTGFKAGEAAELTNKVGPGAALFLLPEPLGTLPEHFFMEKPHVPGTKVYLDPFYNYARYENRRDDERRAAAGRAQVEKLAEVLPALSSAEVATVLNDTDLRRRYVGFVDPRHLDTILLSELDRRRVAEQPPPLTADQLRARDLAAERRLYGEVVETAQAGELVLAPDNLAFAPLFLGLAFAVASQPADPFGTPNPDGSIQPEGIPAVNDAAKRNQQRARGINRELVHERADP